MNVFTVKRLQVFPLLLLLLATILLQQPVSASPFGAGVFGEDVPFGSATSIAVNVDTDPTITTSYGGGFFTGSASHSVTVTSTDVVGYDLYIEDQTTTDMSNGTDTIPTSGNGSPAALATNTWGYNITSSTTNFAGMPGSQTLIKTASGPYKSGDSITVTFGIKVDITKSSGTYSTGVTYTAIGQS